MFNPIAPRKAKIVYNFGLSKCNKVYLFDAELVAEMRCEKHCSEFYQ